MAAWRFMPPAAAWTYQAAPARCRAAFARNLAQDKPLPTARTQAGMRPRPLSQLRHLFGAAPSLFIWSDQCCRLREAGDGASLQLTLI